MLKLGKLNKLHCFWLALTYQMIRYLKFLCIYIIIDEMHTPIVYIVIAGIFLSTVSPYNECVHIEKKRIRIVSDHQNKNWLSRKYTAIEFCIRIFYAISR